MQIVDLLNKSEFLECNETDSIMDYLLKQRVISNKQYQEIVNTSPIKFKNKLLLETLQLNSIEQANENINICGLFVNALRYAGCHHIANILDVDEQIQINKDNNNTRRKGQISVYIQVSAVQIKAKHLQSRQTSQIVNKNSFQANNNSIWLDKRSITANLYDDGYILSRNVAKRSLFSTLFCCFRRNRSRSKNRCNLQGVEICLDSQQPIDKGRQVKIDILTEKSVQFYTHLSSSTAVEREALIKYFEQTHQILVFDTKFDEAAMIVTVICTKQETLSVLQNLLQSGQLEKDFNTLLLSKSIFDLLDVKDVKLSINILPEELRCAMQELDLTKKKRA